MMLLSSSWDYGTFTAPLRSAEDDTLQAVYDAIRFDEMATGYEEKPARALGTVGSQVHTLYLGSEGTYRMLRVSGEWSQTVMEMLRALPDRPKPTRLDAQVTVGRMTDVSNTAERAAEAVLAHQKEGRKGSQPAPRLIKGFGKGDTFNLGSRSSQIYIRVYDKTREMMLDGPPWYWRYEVELKQERAQQALDFWCMSGHTLSAPQTIVESFCEARGIPLPWDAVSDFQPAELPRANTDDERKLEWLRTQVRPSVVSLVKRVGREAVLDALWLDYDSLSE